MEVTKILGLTHLHSERPKLYGVLAVLSAIGLRLVCMELTKTLGVGCLVKWAPDL